MRDEIARLAAELRRRAASSHEEDWAAFGPLSVPVEPPASPPAPSARPAASPPPSPKPAAPVPAEPLPSSQPEGAALSAAEGLAAGAKKAEACRACPLGSTRIKPAYGVGSPKARVMFVGEGPGFAEDHQGEPFVGPAGQLLDKIIASIGLSRETVYIANMVKCHPMVDPSDPEARGNDRPPTPEEIAACRHFLDEQIELIRPEVIVALGAVAAKAMLKTSTGIAALRGKWKEIQVGRRRLLVLPTYHPAALLRNPALKRGVWEDMKSLRERLGGAP